MTLIHIILSVLLVINEFLMIINSVNWLYFSYDNKSRKRYLRLTIVNIVGVLACVIGLIL